MAKNSITDYDNIANNNTDIQSVDIAEGCAPSGINNAIREVMADLADVNDGTVTLTSPKAATLEVTGNLTVDTNTLYVDSANNQVGIGVSSPNAKLDIQAPSSTSAFHIRGDATGNVANFRFYSADGATNYSLIRSSSSEYRINAVQSIPMTFFTNNTERMRIDSSGNLLVGGTTAFGTGTTTINSSGLVYASRSGNKSGHFNRESSDGEIAVFSKDGTTVGRIESVSGVISQIILDPRTGPVLGAGLGGASYDSTSSFLLPKNGLGNTADASVDLGYSSGRFRSLYLSGDVVLGAADGYVFGNTNGVNIRASSGKSTIFDTAGSERMRIDASGNVGIGTSSPATLGGGAKLTVNQAADGNIVFARGGSTRQVQIGTTSTTGYINADNTSGGFAVHTNGTERMRIDSSGNLLVGTTTDGGLNGLTLKKYTTGISQISNVSFGGGFAQHIFQYNGTTVGSILTYTNSTAYNTSSDYRLKENVTVITDGIERVKQLNPSRFNFISDPEKTVDGFIAHEAQAIVPEAVAGEKDAVDAEGNPEYQGIDQSKLVPLLTAALQEAIAKIETLEAKVTALENA